MVAFLDKLLTLLNALVKWLGQKQRREEAERHEDAMQQVQDDPAQWFDNHFNGGRDGSGRVQPDADGDKPAMYDAAGASEAKPTEPDKDG